ncbi:MAG: 3-deoxy-8-phosphooctulonate synthase [Chitinophagales bacterium]|nr:3-deoxy-8-phosphooctulonate synthase [Chitinophagales bacterium]
MNFKQYARNSFFVIAGPCVVESRDLCLTVADKLAEIGQQLNIPIIFKASYKKANRTSIDSFSGIGDEEGLKILDEVKVQTKLPVLTDIHEVKDVEMVRGLIDVIQIPAFLCRQTDLIVAAANTQKPVNIKKGQFASAEMMSYAIEKVKSVGNLQGMLTERGTFLGYEDLVVDFRNIPKMQKLDVPVIYDATHSVQQPGKANGKSGGEREMIEPLCMAAMAIGADGLFVETHPYPHLGLSDSSTMLALHELKRFLKKSHDLYLFKRGL